LATATAIRPAGRSDHGYERTVKHSPAHIVDPPDAGQRLDRVVAALPGVGSRRRAWEAVASGKVDVDGVTAAPHEAGRPVPPGAHVTLHWDRPGTSNALAAARRGLGDLAILHEDRSLVAVDKPAGLLTDAASRRQSLDRDTLVKRLRAYLRVQGGTLHVVHRIDRDTSGVVLLARSEAAALRLASEFRTHRPERVYLAVVHGNLDPPEGEWADWMAWDGRRLVQVPSAPGKAGAVLAQASYRTLRTFAGRASEVEVRLHTGRRNQIRLHLRLAGHPLLGERLYLPDDWEDPGLIAPRQALHARRLVVRHPDDGRWLAVEAPVPEDLAALLEGLARLGRPHPGGSG
jgi:23S rRNA pseudouridine1911/1915/1917 synthase